MSWAYNLSSILSNTHCQSKALRTYSKFTFPDTRACKVYVAVAFGLFTRSVQDGGLSLSINSSFIQSTAVCTLWGTRFCNKVLGEMVHKHIIVQHFRKLPSHKFWVSQGGIATLNSPWERVSCLCVAHSGELDGSGETRVRYFNIVFEKSLLRV